MDAPSQTNSWASLIQPLVLGLDRPETAQTALGLIADAVEQVLHVGPLVVVWRRAGDTTVFQLARSRDVDSGRALIPVKDTIDPPPPGDKPIAEEADFTVALVRPKNGLYIKFGAHNKPQELWILSLQQERDWSLLLQQAEMQRGLLTAIFFIRVGALRHQHLDRQVDDLYASSVHALDPALRLLADLHLEPIPCLDIAARLGHLILEQVLDTEMVDREVVVVSTLRDLRAAESAWGSRCITPGEWGDKLRCMIACFTALKGRDPDTEHIQDKVLKLLPTWVYQREQWSTDAGGSQSEWDNAVTKTVGPLVEWLEVQAARWREAPRKSDGVHPLPSIRNLLTLWFSLHLLGQRSIDPPRRALAYELREGLRFMRFRHRKEDLASLRELVAAHARALVGSRFDISLYLDGIGAEGGVNHYDAREHLRHVLDIYLAGHYFLSLHLPPELGLPDTVAAALFGSAVDDGLRAFSVATLFHDVDLLFLHDRTKAGEALLRAMWGRHYQDRPDYQKSLEKVLDELSTASTVDPTEKVVVKELDAASSLRSSSEEIVDLVKKVCLEDGEKQLGVWLYEQRKELRHGTLSAWFIHRMYRPTDDQKAEDNKPPSYVRQAMRGALLHEAETLEVSLRQDPVAGLLILYNEIFTWDPRRPRGARGEPMIIPAGVTFSADSRGVLRGTLEIDRSPPMDLLRPGGVLPWPRITIVQRGQSAEPIWLRWLQTGVNLARLVPESPLGFSPVIEVISEIPAPLCPAHDTRWLLSRKLRGPASAENLVRWIEALPKEAPGPERRMRDEEWASLGFGAVKPPLLSREDRRLLLAIDREQKQALSQQRQDSRNRKAGHEVPPAIPPLALPALKNQVAVIYAPKDEEKAEELKKHLNLPNTVQVWSPKPGDSSDEKCKELHRSAVIALLVTVDLFDERHRALVRCACAAREQTPKIKVVPVITGKVSWETTEELRGIEPLPKNGRIASDWSDIANELIKLTKESA